VDWKSVGVGFIELIRISFYSVKSEQNIHAVCPRTISLFIRRRFKCRAAVVKLTDGRPTEENQRSNQPTSANTISCDHHSYEKSQTLASFAILWKCKAYFGTARRASRGAENHHSPLRSERKRKNIPSERLRVSSPRLSSNHRYRVRFVSWLLPLRRQSWGRLVCLVLNRRASLLITRAVETRQKSRNCMFSAKTMCFFVHIFLPVKELLTHIYLTITHRQAYS